jgi:hypothetical protein
VSAATLAIATTVYAVTREPLLALVLPWLRGAWEPFRAAFWLLRADPYRARARVCFAFYIAAGCWRAAFEALLAVLAFIGVANATGVPPSEAEALATLWAFAGGLTLSTLIGFCAICAAVLHKLRIWISPSLRHATNNDLRLAADFGWDPKNGANYAVVVIATTLMVPLTVIGAACLISPRGGELAGAIAVFGVPAAGIPVYIWISSRIIARSPQECWPAETVDPMGESRA